MQKVGQILKTVGLILGSAPRGLVYGSRAVSVLLIPALILSTIPVSADTGGAAKTPTVEINRKVPKASPPPLLPQFSAVPTTEEIFRARVFSEPLVALGGEPTAEENHALAAALTRYLQASGAMKLTPLQTFLTERPHSPWRPSLLFNLGRAYRRAGYFTRALETLEAAWTAAKDDESPRGRAVGDAAIGELLDISADFGREPDLERFLAAAEGREVMGPATEKITVAREALAGLQHSHTDAIPSGPMALWRLLAAKHSDVAIPPELKAFHATKDGASLAQIHDLSKKIGLELTPAYREEDVAVPVPSLAHLRSGHFTAVVAKTGTHYKLDDVLLGGEYWITKDALADEGSGYYLIPGEPGDGWRRASRDEITQKRGKCKFGSLEGLKALFHDIGGSGCDDVSYAFDEHLVSLELETTLLHYEPEEGPPVDFTLHYSQRDSSQPNLFTYTNAGPKWNTSWTSDVEDDPEVPAAPAKVRLTKRGTEKYDGFTLSSYRPHRDTRAVLARTGIGPAIEYERRTPSGAIQIFGLADGSLVTPRRVLMTRMVNSRGLGLTFNYDSTARLTSVTDARGQVSMLEYGFQGDPYRVTKVTDPFGRFATLGYDHAGRLTRVTNTRGISTTFEYGSGDFIRSLVRPTLGRLSFSAGQTTTTLGAVPKRWIEVRDGHGGLGRLEYHFNNADVPATDPPASVPKGFGPNAALGSRNAYYWDKRSFGVAGTDFSKARVSQWALGAVLDITPVRLTTKKALESRVWYSYDQNTMEERVGPMSLPVKVGQVLDDGSSQISRYEWNTQGKLTRYTDPVGRVTVFEYDPSGRDLLRTYQKNGAQLELLSETTYNAQHLPLVTKDASGQPTTIVYNAAGKPTSITNAKSETSTFTYNSAGQLESITGPIAGSTVTFTYDEYGRPKTGSHDGQTVALEYDAGNRPTKLTYPDSSFEQVVASGTNSDQYRDAAGRWTTASYDGQGRVTGTREPDGTTTTMDRCDCGQPDKLTDPAGNVTHWEYDAQGRVVKEIKADNTTIETKYEANTSRVHEVKDQKGQITHFEYFLDGALKKVWYSGAANPPVPVAYAYDPAYPRLVSRTDGTTDATTYAYNPITTPPTLGAGALASIDGPLANDIIAYTYDELGRVVGETTNGVAATRAFDALDRLRSVTNTLGTFTYNYIGTSARLSDVQYPSGQSTQFGYYAANEGYALQEIHNKYPGGTTLSKHTYTYDSADNTSTWTQQTDSNPATVLEVGYDALDQLTSATLKSSSAPAVALKTYGYSYDAAGNRRTEAVDESGLVVSQSTFNNLNQLTSQQGGGMLRFKGVTNEPATVTVQGQAAVTTTTNAFDAVIPVLASPSSTTVALTATDPAGNSRTSSYSVPPATAPAQTLTYDLNGNLITDGTRTYDWDAADQLVAITQGSQRSEFTYDGVGHRVRIVEKDGGTVTSDKRFLWCGSEICEERNASGTTQKRFFSQGVQEGSTNYLYSSDHLGNIRELTNSSGALQTRYDYTPFGKRTKVAGTLESDHGFTGHYTHERTGLALTLFRAYDPTQGRWLSPDPIGIAGGVNLYGYVGNNPVNDSDALGLSGSGNDGGAPTLPCFMSMVWDNLLESILEIPEQLTTRQGIFLFLLSLWPPARLPLMAYSMYSMAPMLLAAATATHELVTNRATHNTGVVLASVMASLILAGVRATKARAPKGSKTFLVYTIRDGQNRVLYVGRASGHGTPQQVLEKRMSNHWHRDDGRFQIEDINLTREANRGAEQALYDRYRLHAASGDANRTPFRHPQLRNLLQPIWRWNTNRITYMNAYHDEMKLK